MISADIASIFIPNLRTQIQAFSILLPFIHLLHNIPH